MDSPLTAFVEKIAPLTESVLKCRNIRCRIEFRGKHEDATSGLIFQFGCLVAWKVKLLRPIAFRKELKYSLFESLYVFPLKLFKVLVWFQSVILTRPILQTTMVEMI
jgi:hypothetical protein